MPVTFPATRTFCVYHAHSTWKHPFSPARPSAALLCVGHRPAQNVPPGGSKHWQIGLACFSASSPRVSPPPTTVQAWGGWFMPRILIRQRRLPAPRLPPVIPDLEWRFPFTIRHIAALTTSYSEELPDPLLPLTCFSCDSEQRFPPQRPAQTALAHPEPSWEDSSAVSESSEKIRVFHFHDGNFFNFNPLNGCLPKIHRLGSS